MARGLPVPGAGLAGVHQAMEFLPLANRAVVASQARTGGGPVPEPPISARGKNVIIIGGGDTGADCLGTAHRQGAASVTQLEILPRPTQSRPDHQPWPTYPMIYRVSSAHEEGGERVYAVSTQEFVGDGAGRVRGAAAGRGGAGRRQVRPGPGDRAGTAVRAGPAGHGLHRGGPAGLLTDLGVEFDARGNVARDGAVRHLGARGVRGR